MVKTKFSFFKILTGKVVSKITEENNNINVIDFNKDGT